MNATALKEHGVTESYPVSDEARQRIDSAHTRAMIFEARRILLEGGYRAGEVEAILTLVRPYLHARTPVDAELVRKGLVARQFAKKDAESIASALAGS